MVINGLADDFLVYCSERRKLSTATIRAYRNDLQQFSAFVEANEDEREAVENYIDNISKKYTKTKTIKRKIASIKSFYSYLEYIDVVDRNPFSKIRTKIKEPVSLPRTISKEVINMILLFMYKEMSEGKSEFQKRTALRNVTAIEIMICTGIRISELCNIRIEDINLKEGKLRVIGKGNKERQLYIGNEHVTKVIEKYIDVSKSSFRKQEYLFENFKGNKLTEQSIRKALINIEYKLKLNFHLTPHMFRHTYATSLLDKDVDIRYIQKILGHSSISVTQIYTHVSDEKKREIMNNKNPRNDYLYISNETH